MEDIISLNPSQLSSELKNLGDSLVFVIDRRVHELYGHYFSTLNGPIWIAPQGEEVKGISHYETCMEYLLEKGVHRHSHLVAIGGGATSDFAGFVAATLLRGISWSVIPTTLLAMVDASIGGKTALNSKHGKNLIGSFHFPKRIFIAPDFLKTLPQNQLNSGKGEILKYAFLSEDIQHALFQKIPLEEVIQKCANYKKEIVARDPIERGERAILNLGHTLGHALEKFYKIDHGIAVLWGMYLFYKLFDYQEEKRILKELKKILIPDELKLVIHDGDWDQLLKFITKDKKNILNDHISFVQVKNFKMERKDISEKDLRELIMKKLKGRHHGFSLA